MLYNHWVSLRAFGHWHGSGAPVVDVCVDRARVRHFHKHGPVWLQLVFYVLEMLSFLFVFEPLLHGQNEVVNEAINVLTLTWDVLELRKTEPIRKFFTEFVFHVQLFEHSFRGFLESNGQKELI